MDIGQHCMECGRLDFLPFDCHKCGMILCADHRLHDCKVSPETTTIIERKAEPAPSVKPVRAEKLNARAEESKTQDLSKSQNLSGSQKPTRSQRQTTTTATNPPSKSSQKLGTGNSRSTRAEATLDRLRQMFKPRPAKTKPTKESAGPTPIQKRDAVGDSSVPLANRVYLQIERSESQVEDQLTHTVSTRPAKQVWMFFDQDTSAGQLLDKAAPHLGILRAALQVDGAPVDLGRSVKELTGIKLVINPT